LLTGQQVRVRHARHKLVPLYLPPHDPEVLAAAGQFLVAYREAAGKTRGELAELLADLLAEGPNQLVHQGFAKLLEDR